jgi:hypothetical protein
LSNGLILVGVSDIWQYIIKGLVIIVAVASRPLSGSKDLAAPDARLWEAGSYAGKQGAGSAQNGGKHERRIETARGYRMAATLAMPAAAKDLQKIGISVGLLGNPFFVATIKGIEDRAKEINPNVR